MTYPETWAYPPGQLTQADLKALTPEDYEQARDEGRLDRLLGAGPRPPAEGQLTRADIAHMTPQQIDDARQAGQFETLLRGDTAA
ncbi:hypothetical protein [Streptomyces globisporus]|uniref:hypothetical protein n=1 Tax=Streptomyces globisporus TaxID=1908 RepID=UPI003793FE66